MEKLLVDKDYQLHRFAGKGGWTYAELPEIRPDPHAHFGWVRVRGSIDSFSLKQYHLMPMGNGNLFLPVRTEIRKKIGKREGDWVRVVLYEDKGPTEVPSELIDCLQEEPRAYDQFMALSDSERKGIVDWIYSAKKDDIKVERIAKSIDKLLL